MYLPVRPSNPLHCSRSAVCVAVDEDHPHVRLSLRDTERSQNTVTERRSPQVDELREMPAVPLTGILIRVATVHPGEYLYCLWTAALIYAVGGTPAAMACRAAMWIFMAVDPAGDAVSQVRGRLPT